MRARPRSCRAARTPRAAARARMDREHHLQLPRQRQQRLHQLRELGALIDVRGPVQRHDRVRALAERELRARVAPLDARAQHLERVDHDIADAVDPARRVIPSASRLASASGRRRPQKIRDGIRHPPVDLLGHASIVAAQARFQVHHRDPQLRPHHRAGRRGIDIAHHHDRIRPARPRRRARTRSWCDRSARHACRCRPPGGRPARAVPGRERRHRTCSRRNAARYAPPSRAPVPLQGVIQGGHLHEVRACGSDQVDGLRAHGTFGFSRDVRRKIFQTESRDMLADAPRDYTGLGRFPQTWLYLDRSVSTTVCRGRHWPRNRGAGTFHRSITTGTIHGALERLEYRNRSPPPPPPRAAPAPGPRAGAREDQRRVFKPRARVAPRPRRSATR